MKRYSVVMIVLALVMASTVMPACAGWWSGDNPSVGTDAFPVNQLRLTPRYRDTFEPMVFNVASRVDKDGNPLDIVTAFFEENMTIIQGDRPLMATCPAKIMMGEGGLGEMYATYGGEMIKLIIEPPKGGENKAAWLYSAIKLARIASKMESDPSKSDPQTRYKQEYAEKLKARQAGREPSLDPGEFPPFVTVPAESRPRVMADGRIVFANPQQSVKIEIVVPISNQLDGDGCYVSLFVKHRKGMGKLWEQTSANFVMSHMARVTVPNPALRERAQTDATEPPPFKGRVRSVTRPTEDEPPTATATATPTPQTIETIRRVVYGDFQAEKYEKMTWNCPGKFRAYWDMEGGNAGFLTFLIKADGSLLEEGEVEFTLNGKRLWAKDGTAQRLVIRESNNRGGVVFYMCPPGTKVWLRWNVGGRSTEKTFTTPETGWITYQPVFEGER